MRSLTAITAALVILLCGINTSYAASDDEQILVNRFLKQAEESHTNKLTFASFNFSMDRINRNNDYNSFATYTSQQINGASFNWLDNGFSVGAEVGMVFKERIAWSVGGEYWFKMGETISGSYIYDSPLTTATTVDNPTSEMWLLGFTTGAWYYPFEHPTVRNGLTKLSLRVGGNVGFYTVNWDLWDEYASLNMATENVAGNNISFKGTTLGFNVGVGGDLPIKFWGLTLGAEVAYQYLNFTNVAWYNTTDQEIIATYNGTTDGRVDLDLSGLRGKIEIKRFFSW
ncbi:MAG TPA: hypothetical protein PLF13_07845 [candidate division Zixibacteria bacterium]|nr:hypothetical protein [candidate division Zixibacteria bacterium]